MSNFLFPEEIEKSNRIDKQMYSAIQFFKKQSKNTTTKEIVDYFTLSVKMSGGEPYVPVIPRKKRNAASAAE